MAEKSRSESEAKASAEKARALVIEAQEKVVTVKEREIAERRKYIELVEAAKLAERDALKLTVSARAEREASAERALAQNELSKAAEYRYEVDAEGHRKLNEAENMRSEAARRSKIQEKLIENLPEIIEKSVKPMESIESIRILQVDGLPGLSGVAPAAAGGGGSSGDSAPSDGSPRTGSLADNVVNSALRYRAQAPFVDGLLQEIGMNPNAMSSLGELSNVGNFVANALPEPDKTETGRGRK